MVKKRSTAKARFYRRQALSFFERNTLIVVLGIIFLFGIACGTRLISRGEEGIGQALNTMMGNFIEIRSTQDINTTLLTTFLSSLGLLVGIFLSGFSAVFIPVIIFILFFKGLGFGLSAAGLISNMGADGVFFTGVLLIPNTVISAIILLFAAKNAIMLSKYLFMFLFKGETRSENISLSGYFFIFMLFAGFLAIGAALESVLFNLFGGFLF